MQINKCIMWNEMHSSPGHISVCTPVNIAVKYQQNEKVFHEWQEKIQ